MADLTNIGNQNKINRVRRLSVEDDWPRCFLCGEEFSSGFTFYDNDGPGCEVSILSVCDTCLQKAKQSRIGWFSEGDIQHDESEST